MHTRHDNKPASNTPSPAVRRWLMAAALAAAAAAGASVAGGAPALPHHGAQHAHLPLDPAAMDAHIDQMVALCAADASPDQQARVAAIAKAAVADLRPAHTQLREAHARAHALLMAPVVDRAALEQLRAAQMQQMDIASRRILLAVEDAADVLTPAQRAAFAGQLWRRMH